MKKGILSLLIPLCIINDATGASQSSAKTFAQKNWHAGIIAAAATAAGVIALYNWFKRPTKKSYPLKAREEPRKISSTGVEQANNQIKKSEEQKKAEEQILAPFVKEITEQTSLNKKLVRLIIKRQNTEGAIEFQDGKIAQSKFSITQSLKRTLENIKESEIESYESKKGLYFDDEEAPIMVSSKINNWSKADIEDTWVVFLLTHYDALNTYKDRKLFANSMFKALLIMQAALAKLHLKITKKIDSKQYLELRKWIENGIIEPIYEINQSIGFDIANSIAYFNFKTTKEAGTESINIDLERKEAFNIDQIIKYFIVNDLLRKVDQLATNN